MLNGKKGISLIILVLIVVAIIAISAVTIALVMNNDNDSSNINNSLNNSTEDKINTNNSEKGNDITTQQKENKSIENYAWDDFVISIDGNIIAMGSKASSLENFGFTPDSSNYNEELEKGQGLYTIFNYNKNSQVLDQLSCRVYNHFEEVKPLKNCELVRLEIDSDFIKNLDVVLPGGLLLKDSTTIDDIVNSMGQYTKKIARTYHWTDENYSSIEIKFDTNGQLSMITYNFNIVSN